jgi:hypothetical protein
MVSLKGRALQILTIVAVLFACALGHQRPALAQALIWNLPPDGTWVRYEGNYREVQLRPDNPEGDLTIEWIRHLTIKSVGTETAEFEGQLTACRWIEIESITGVPSELGIDPGPAGARIVKVLVPENRIVGTLVDADQIPVAFVPVVKGLRQFGNGPIEPIETGVLRVYPLLTLLAYYPDLQPAGTPEQLSIPLGAVQAQQYTGSLTMESRTSRSVNRAELWRSDAVPFGLAQWSVQLTREEKQSFQPRSEFQARGEVREEMSAHEVGTGAESRLNMP